MYVTCAWVVGEGWKGKKRALQYYIKKTLQVEKYMKCEKKQCTGWWNKLKTSRLLIKTEFGFLHNDCSNIFSFLKAKKDCSKV